MAYSETALTTLATLKAYVGITDSAADAVLTSMITRASTLVCRYIGRDEVFTKSKTETLNGNGGSFLMLKLRPITAITSVTVNGTVIPPSAGAGQPGYLFDERGVYLVGYVFSRGVQNVTIVYTGGIDQSHPDVAILEQATMEIVFLKWKRRDHVDLQSTSMNGIQTASYTMKDIPAESKLALSSCRSVVPL